MSLALWLGMVGGAALLGGDEPVFAAGEGGALEEVSLEGVVAALVERRERMSSLGWRCRLLNRAERAPADDWIYTDFTLRDEGRCEFMQWHGHRFSEDDARSVCWRIEGDRFLRYIPYERTFSGRRPATPPTPIAAHLPLLWLGIKPTTHAPALPTILGEPMDLLDALEAAPRDWSCRELANGDVLLESRRTGSRVVLVPAADWSTRTRRVALPGSRSVELSAESFRWREGRWLPDSLHLRGALAGHGEPTLVIDVEMLGWRTPAGDRSYLPSPEDVPGAYDRTAAGSHEWRQLTPGGIELLDRAAASVQRLSDGTSRSSFVSPWRRLVPFLILTAWGLLQLHRRRRGRSLA